MLVAFIGLWALSFGITFFSMTKTFNDISENASSEKIHSEVAQTISNTAWINGIATILGVLGVVFIISAVFVKIFSKKQIIPSDAEPKANG
jgi:beta-lactamase regulating signal transducer with metallopeptidase domain